MSAACPEYGFDVALTPAPGLSEPEVARLCALLARSVLQPNGLLAEPHPARALCQTVSRDGGQATEADRALVSAWAAARPEIAACEVGPLVDLGPSA